MIIFDDEGISVNIVIQHLFNESSYFAGYPLFSPKNFDVACVFRVPKLNSAADNQNNRAFCGASMKFDTLIAKGSRKRFGYGAIINFQHGTSGSHFFKMATSSNCFLMSDGHNMMFQTYLPYRVLGRCLG